MIVSMATPARRSGHYGSIRPSGGQRFVGAMRASPCLTKGAPGRVRKIFRPPIDLTCPIEAHNISTDAKKANVTQQKTIAVVTAFSLWVLSAVGVCLREDASLHAQGTQNPCRTAAMEISKNGCMFVAPLPPSVMSDTDPMLPVEDFGVDLPPTLQPFPAHLKVFPPLSTDNLYLRNKALLL